MNEWLNSVYKDYHGWKGWESDRNAGNEIARAVAELRITGVAPPARLLEIGFGDGAFLRRAKTLGYECAGLERESPLLADLAAQGIDAREGMPNQFGNRKFDLIVAFDVFEHIPIADLIQYLRQLCDLLDADGKLLARFPNMASPFGLLTQYGDITHVTALSPASLVQVARTVGLELVTAANGATVLGGSGAVKTVLKPLALLTRKIIEAIVSFAYLDRLTPLSPSVVVVLRKRSAGDVG